MIFVTLDPMAVKSNDRINILRLDGLDGLRTQCHLDKLGTHHFWNKIGLQLSIYFQLHQITRRSVPTLARWNCVRSCPSDHWVSRYWYGHSFWPPLCQRSQKSLCTVHSHGIFVPWKSHTKNLSSICITHCQFLTEIFIHSWCTYELPIDTIRLVLNFTRGFGELI